MEYLAGLYTLLLVAICLELAVVLWRTGKKQGSAPDHDELKRWMQQQLDAQAREFAARQSALAEQNHTALRSVSETLQTAVQNMSTMLAQGQDSQQQLLERRLRSLEASNTQKLEELRRSMAESMTALQAENNRSPGRDRSHHTGVCRHREQPEPDRGFLQQRRYPVPCDARKHQPCDCLYF